MTNVTDVHLRRSTQVSNRCNGCNERNGPEAGNGRPLVRIGTGEVIEVDLNHCNHCVQRFKSVVQYREAAEDYRAHVQRSSALVEDAITGRSLRVRDPEPAAPHLLWQTTVTAPLPCRTRHRRLR